MDIQRLEIVTLVTVPSCTVQDENSEKKYLKKGMIENFFFFFFFFFWRERILMRKFDRFALLFTLKL